MFKFILKKLKKNNKGFTLVELVVVIAILGILAAVAVPKLSTSRKSAAIAAHNANVRTLMNAANIYYAETGEAGEWPGDENEETWKNYLQEWPEIPDGLEEEDFDGTNVELKYKVSIQNNGEITVTPGLIDNSSEEE